MPRQVEQRVSTHDFALDKLQKADRENSRGNNRLVAACCSLRYVAFTRGLGFGMPPRDERTAPRLARVVCFTSGAGLVEVYDRCRKRRGKSHTIGAGKALEQFQNDLWLIRGADQSSAEL